MLRCKWVFFRRNLDFDRSKDTTKKRLETPSRAEQKLGAGWQYSKEGLGLKLGFLTETKMLN